MTAPKHRADVPVDSCSVRGRWPESPELTIGRAPCHACDHHMPRHRAVPTS